MKLALFSDLQAADKTDRCFTDSAIPLQRWRVQKFYEWLWEMCEVRGVDGVIDAGDTTDRRDSIALPTIDTILTWSAKFGERYGKGVNIKVQGNHDHHVKNGTIHNGAMFAHGYRVVCDKVERLSFKDGTAIVCAPFSEDTDTLTRQIVAARDPNCMLIGHFQTVGARMNSGISQAGIALGALSGYAAVLLGHVHKPQQLGDGIHYIGSPFQQDFGEAGEDKRVAIIDTKKKTVEWIPVHGFPKYRSLRLDDFLKLERAHPEDRFKVTVSGMEEAGRVAGHGLGAQAEPVYVDAGATSVQEEAEARAHWSLETAVRSWVANHPYADFNHYRKAQEDVLSDDDLVDLGLSVLS